MASLKPLVDWMYSEIMGIEDILRRIAPRYHLSDGQVVTGPKELESMGSGAVQRSPDPGGRRDWARLPAIQHAMGEPPLVAPNRPFASALAAADRPAPILAPLSHGKSLDAPKGIVSGIARPAEQISGPAVPAAVQRSPIRRRGQADEPVETIEEAIAEPVVAARAAPIGEAPAAPIVRAPTVTAAPPARRLTSAPTPARSAPLVGLVGQPRAGRGEASLAAPGIQRAPAAPTPSVAPVGQTAAKPAAPGASPRPVAAPGAPRLTVGQVRRLGLGAPVSGGPMLGSGASLRLPEIARPTPAMPTSPDASAAQRATAATAQDMPLAPVSRPSEPAAASVHDAPPLPETSSPALPNVLTPVTGRPIAPLPEPGVNPAAESPIVSAKPLRTKIQRAPLTLPQRSPDGGDGHGVTLPAATPGGTGDPVKIHRDGSASQMSTAMSARSFTHGGEIFLPASHGPLTSGTGKALLAHELTHVAQQRRMGSGLPEESSPHGQSLEADAVAAERSPDRTLGMPGALAATPTGVPVTSSSSAPSRPGPQRAPTAGAPSAPSGKSGATTAASGGSGGHTHSEQELEVLAHQLYHRIGRHLRRELLVDRERVGFALDLP